MVENHDLKDNDVVDSNDKNTCKNPDSTNDNSQIETLNTKLAEERDKYVRLSAEFDNYRKRTNKEKCEIIERAEKDLLTELLSVVDDFRRALDASADEGFKLINSKLCKILVDKGLQKIKTEIGDSFDSNIHEAITTQPTKDKKLDGKIIGIIEYGYMFRSKILRFAKVVIGEYKD